MVFVILVAFFFPQRILRGIDIPGLHHTRTYILSLYCYVLCLLEKTDFR
jgi:hypothetical protein